MSKEPAVDYSEIEAALGSIGLSAILILGATFLRQGIGFTTRITMARYLPVEGYGDVVLGISMMNLLGIITLAGLPAALSRYVPRKETNVERRDIVVSTFHIVGALSLVIATAAYLLAGPVSRFVFGTENLVWIFRIFAAVLPFYTMFRLSIGGFRGYEETLPQVVTDKILLPALQLAGIIVFVTLGYDTAGIAFAYAAAFLFVSATAMFYMFRLGEFSISDIATVKSPSRYRELLAFSLPLAASGAIGVITKNSDLIILGIFQSSAKVGVYEVVYRLAMFITFFISPAVGYLFQPLISRFDASDDHRKIDQLYTVTTRWIVIGTYPLFVLLLLFPDQTLLFFFGQEYTEGALALSILATGFMFSRLPGLTGNFLTATGKTKIVLYISTATAVLNVGANIILVPTYGLLGAAIATASARVFNNTVQSYLIVREFGVHPFKRDYLLPVSLMGLLCVSAFISPISFDKLTFVQGFIIASGMGLAALLILLLTRSIYKVEVNLIDTLLHRAGVPLSVSSVLQPFLR